MQDYSLVVKCDSCVYKDASPSEGWCYLFKYSPKVECERFVTSADARIIAGINELESSFPERFNDE